MKELLKVFSDGLVILQEWRMIGFLNECMWSLLSRFTVEKMD